MNPALEQELSDTAAWIDQTKGEVDKLANRGLAFDVAVEDRPIVVLAGAERQKILRGGSIQ
jgi:hypothetical protein